MTAPLFPRRLRPIVVETLRHARIVLISGARQVGKTTLTTGIAAADHPMRALTLDDRPTREAALQDPAGFVAGINGPVLIDEIQRAPDLLLEIKKVVDRDTTPGRFLLTGSASVLSSKRIIDALTGRIDRIRMWPLAQSEISGGRLNIVDELLAGRAPQLNNAPVGRQAFASVIAEGGYPEARLRPPGRSREQWFEATSTRPWSATCVRSQMRGVSTRWAACSACSPRSRPTCSPIGLSDSAWRCTTTPSKPT